MRSNHEWPQFHNGNSADALQQHRRCSAFQTSLFKLLSPFLLVTFPPGASAPPPAFNEGRGTASLLERSSAMLHVLSPIAKFCGVSALAVIGAGVLWSHAGTRARPES